MPATTKPRTTRRQFMGQAAVAASGAISLPYIVPASALGGGGAVAPSDRIVMGFIGTGGMGTNNMQQFMKEPDVQVVAVCDVERESNRYRGATCGREPAQAKVHEYYAANRKSGSSKGCVAFADFRELLARDDINAVCIATPDHWHALASVAAAQAGKDIYCEKPLANSIGEGRAVCQAVEENKRVLQTGSHERSGDSARYACELVRNGRIGKLHTIRINLPVGEGHHKEVMAFNQLPQPMPVPEGFDYDFWLGHTAAEPYHERRCHFWWRFILNYGGGEMTDRGAHVIDLAQLGAGTDDTGPVEIEASGQRSQASLYDAFMEFHFENKFANGVRMIGQNGGQRGVKFEGSDGWIFIEVHGGRLEADPVSLLSEKIGDSELHLGRTTGHRRNFLDAVKSRQQPFAPAEVGHRTGTICHLNNIAMLTGRKLQWDPEHEQIVGDDDANRLLTPSMREPWHL